MGPPTDAFVDRTRPDARTGEVGRSPSGRPLVAPSVRATNRGEPLWAVKGRAHCPQLRHIAAAHLGHAPGRLPSTRLRNLVRALHHGRSAVRPGLWLSGASERAEPRPSTTMGGVRAVAARPLPVPRQTLARGRRILVRAPRRTLAGCSAGVVRFSVARSCPSKPARDSSGHEGAAACGMGQRRWSRAGQNVFIRVFETPDHWESPSG